MEIDGLRIHYYDFGPREGAPLLFHVHGYMGGGIEALSLSEALPGWRVLAPDLPGSGFSASPASGYGASYLAGFVARFVEALAPGSKFALSAHSMGASIALEYAVRYAPEGLTRIALWAPDGYQGEEGPLLSLASSDFLFSLYAALLSRPFYDLGAMLNVFHDPSRLKEPFRSVLREGNFATGWKDRLKSLTRLALGILRAEELAPLVRQPVLVVWGRQDRVLGFEWSARFMEDLPDGRLLAIDGCGHVPHVERMDVAGPALRAFLAGGSAE
jgi:pimeloyl-ACP methyl ester carboxylesterase